MGPTQTRRPEPLEVPPRRGGGSPEEDDHALPPDTSFVTPDGAGSVRRVPTPGPTQRILTRPGPSSGPESLPRSTPSRVPHRTRPEGRGTKWVGVWGAPWSRSPWRSRRTTTYSRTRCYCRSTGRTSRTGSCSSCSHSVRGPGSHAPAPTPARECRGRRRPKDALHHSPLVMAKHSYTYRACRMDRRKR